MFLLCWVLKRICFHNQPTPIVVILIVMGAFALSYILIPGLLLREWRDAFLLLAAVYAGFACFLYVVGDISYYRYLAKERRSTFVRPAAPEDHPDWTNYQP